MIVIGITGTLGAGKGTIVEYLKNRLGFVHFSVRDFLKEEIIKRGMTVNRDTLTDIANEIRKKHSPSYITDQLYDKAIRAGKNCIIESIRTPGEVESLRSKGRFYLFAVDADPKIRYQRIRARGSETDNVGYHTFLDNEGREFTSADPNKQNLQQCIRMADFVFTNNTTIEQLQGQVAIVIEKILNKAG